MPKVLKPFNTSTRRFAEGAEITEGELPAELVASLRRAGYLPKAEAAPRPAPRPLPPMATAADA